jgi:glycosyltransferase involved in cell wall biosynthesis
MPELYMSWNHGPRSLVVRLLRLQEKFSCWMADRVISVNETMRENLCKKGVPNEKIFIVHNFPDQNYFPVRHTDRSWPRTTDSLVVLYCGTVTEHYDLGLAVKAMAALVGEIPIKLRIMGDGNRLGEVLDLATKLGVRESIELVRKVPIEKVADEMAKADVGISCHLAGIFGDLYFSTKIIEYLTQGLCVVAPRTYTINKYLSDQCVFYFPPSSLNDMVDTFRLVWRSPGEVRKRVTHAREHLQRLSWQAEKGRFVEFYSELLSDSVAAAAYERSN